MGLPPFRPRVGEQHKQSRDRTGCNKARQNNPRITPAFQARNIAAPCIEGRAQVTPGAFVPAVFVTGSQPITVPVTIIAGTASITPATAALRYRFGASGDFASVPMAQVGPPGSYTATLPTLLCGQAIQYYYSVETSEGEVTYPPPLLPARRDAEHAGDGLVLVVR